MGMVEVQDLIVDDRARGVFRVNRRAFTDPEILEEERREVFLAVSSLTVLARSPVRRSRRNTDSPVEGTGFEPSVPRQEKWLMPSSSDRSNTDFGRRC